MAESPPPEPPGGKAIGGFAVGAHMPGATPIDPDEATDLIPPTVHTWTELNAFEQVNITAAVEWLLRGTRRASPATVLSERYLLDLHHRMFDQTWRWAGELRRTDKTIGVHWPQIRMALRDRLEDTRHWIGAKSYPPEEIAVRFHHAIVVIHPFPNGNGRWSRLAADALLHAQRRPLLTWGQSSLTAVGTARTAYLAALRAADQGDFAPLMAFARS